MLHPYLRITASSLQRLVLFVPTVVVMEKYDRTCILDRNFGFVWREEY